MGNRTTTSDIDVFIHLVTRKVEEDLFDLAYNLDLKYDWLFDITALSVADTGIVKSHYLTDIVQKGPLWEMDSC